MSSKPICECHSYAKHGSAHVCMWGSIGGLSTLFKDATCCIFHQPPVDGRWILGKPTILISNSKSCYISSRCLPFFNITLTVTVQRCDVKGKHWKVLKHVVHESFLSTYLFFLATRTEFDFVYIYICVYIYIVGIKDPIFWKTSKISIFQPPFLNLYNSVFVHVNNLILQISSRKATHLFCQGFGLLALAIRTRNLTGVPFFLWEISFRQGLDGQGERIQKLNNPVKLRWQL